jgi:signal transduction histidine kinase
MTRRIHQRRHQATVQAVEMTVLTRSASRWRALSAWFSEFSLLFAAVAADLMVWSNDNQLRSGGHTPPWLIPAGSIATLAILLLRRRHPVPVLAIQLAWATWCGTEFTQYTPLTGMLIAVNALARYRPSGYSLAGWAACGLPFVTYLQGSGDVQWQITYLFVLMLLAGAAWLLGYRTRLADQRAAERDAAAAEAVRSERLRIARELHDIVAHAVSVMVLQSAGARAVLATDPAGAEAALDIVQDVGKQSMNELRRLLGLLRAASDDGDLPGIEEQPGLDGVDTLISNARATGLTITKQVWGTPGLLDASVSLTAYRLVQEALTNTLKHAGSGATTRVGLTWAPEKLTFIVQNEASRSVKRPSGATSLSTGYGLLGLRERVQTVGGTLHAGPTDGGFVVQGVLPVAAPPLPASQPVHSEPEKAIH